MPNKNSRVRVIEDWMKKTAPQRAKDRDTANSRFEAEINKKAPGYFPQSVADPQGLNHKPTKRKS